MMKNNVSIFYLHTVFACLYYIHKLRKMFFPILIFGNTLTFTLKYDQLCYVYRPFVICVLKILKTLLLFAITMEGGPRK